jgi:flavodoxin I
MQFLVNFNGKKVAYFDAETQVVYLDTFQDAMGIVEERILELRSETVGYWSTDNYEFTDSKAVCNGKFVDLR